MKNKKKPLLLVLALALCLGTFSCKPQSTIAANEITLNPESTLRTKNYEGKKILIGIREKTSFRELLGMLSSEGNINISKGDLSIGLDDNVTTGMIVSSGNTQLYAVVKGDVDGDGNVSTTDFLQLKKYFQGNFTLGGLFSVAADISENGIIETTDYFQLKQYFLGEYDIYSKENAPVEPVEPATPIEIIINGGSEYKIRYNGENNKAAAYTLQELLKDKSGVLLPIEQSSSVNQGDKVIFLNGVDESTVGNYGYNIDTDETFVTISASSLSGFDKGFSRLMSDNLSGGSLIVFTDYDVSDKLNWGTNYVLEGTDYNANYNSDIFYNDKNDSVAYVSNTMWHMFGAVDDGKNVVSRFGNEPTWFEWNSEKISWCGNTTYMSDLKRRIRYFPQTSTGYVWSWGSYPYWKVDNCYSIHYDGTFRYISAVYDIITWEGNTDFLYVKDSDTVSGQYSEYDSSRGKTVLKKTQACMDYILEYLYGKYGYIQLTEESTYLNSTGSKRFDYVKEAGIYCWNNTGKDGSGASNYWDNLCFGNYDGYTNALYYNALLDMAGIYRMMGGDAIDDAEQLEVLAAKVKEEFNKRYWSEETGRYGACVDTDGKLVDYGFTFHNFEIMKYGLAEADQATSIFNWVDGDRIVPGDTRTGKDIFSYGKLMELVNYSTANEIAKLNLRLAAVSNTVPINNPQNQALGVAWWHAPDGINVWTSASYGKHLENGGYIFYPVFYELMARTQYEGAQSTTDRLNDISRVYEYNRLLSDAAAAGSTYWLEGLVGEFPESGLVPTVYLYSLVGLSAEYDGLHLSPSFNDVYEYMGVKSFGYGGKKYGIKVNRDSSFVLTPSSTSVSLKIHYTPDRFDDVSYTISVKKTSGAVTTKTVQPDINGVLNIQLNETYVSSIEVTPNLK